MSGCFCIGQPGNCPCLRRALLDMPFDAPRRLEELKRQIADEKAREFYKSDEFKQIVRDALSKCKSDDSNQLQSTAPDQNPAQSSRESGLLRKQTGASL